MRGRNCASSSSTAPLPPCWPARMRHCDSCSKAIGQTGVPIEKDKALNERMYGELQGLNKAETAKKYGDEQVKIWRRSYDVRPPGEKA